MTVARDYDAQESGVFTRVGRVNNTRIFRAARRHSWSVRVLRIAIPVCVVVAAAAGIASVSKVNLQVLTKAPVDISGVVVSGTKITMKQPRIAGYTSDQRAYEMTAQTAAQDLLKNDVVELQGIRAIVEMQDQVQLQTTAKFGVYDTKTEQLTLQQNVAVDMSNGYRARLAEAVIDIRGGKISSEKPVEVSSHDWTVNANRLEVIDSGNTIRFERGVSVTLLGNIELPRLDASANTSPRKK